MNKTKQELIEEIEKREADRLMTLSRLELEKEYMQWFEGSIPENVRILDRATLLNDLIEDFTKYRQDDSIEELKEKLGRYNQ